MKKTKIFLAKAIPSGTIVSLTNQEGHYKRIRIVRQVFVNYHVFDILEVKFENVKSTTILFLSMFHCHFSFVSIRIAKFRHLSHFLKLSLMLSYFCVLIESR